LECYVSQRGAYTGSATFYFYYKKLITLCGASRGKIRFANFSILLGLGEEKSIEIEMMYNEMGRLLCDVLKTCVNLRALSINLNQFLNNMVKVAI
jgi:hypothetical protein